jgi:hypothetical protein
MTTSVGDGTRRWTAPTLDEPPRRFSPAPRALQEQSMARPREAIVVAAEEAFERDHRFIS